MIKKLLDMKAVGGWTRGGGGGESIHSYSSLTLNSIRFERSIAENLIGSNEKKRSFPDQRLGPNFLLKKLGKKSSRRLFCHRLKMEKIRSGFDLGNLKRTWLSDSDVEPKAHFSEKSNFRELNSAHFGNLIAEMIFVLVLEGTKECEQKVTT